MSPADNDQSEAELLKALLAERDLPCPVCGYNLRAIASTNCPECGAKLDLRVGSTDLKLGPWLIAILALALPLGFVGIYAVLLGVIAAIAPSTFGGFDPVLLAVISVAMAISAAYAAVLWRLVRNRRNFWAKPRKAQRRAALLYALIGPGALVLIFVLVSQLNIGL